MRITGFLKRVSKPFVDVPTWMGAKQLAEMTRGVGESVKLLFLVKKPTSEESFTEALQRYNLTEEDVGQRIRAFVIFSIFWLGVSVAVLLYGIYLAGLGSWFGFLACLGISLISLAQAFYYHFWMFQMKQRRLGCSWREWWNASFSGGGGA